MAPMRSEQSEPIAAPTDQARFQAGSAVEKPSVLTHNPLTATWKSLFGSSKKRPQGRLPETSGLVNVLSLSRKPKPAGPDLYVALARMSEQAGNVQQATAQYERAIDVDPNSLDALRGYAHLQDRQGDFDQAIPLYKRAIQAHPEHAGARNDFGLCLARAGRLPESAAALAQAVQLQPERALYRNNLATVLAEQGDSEAALAHWTTTQGPAIAHYNLARLLQRGGSQQEAAAHFRIALQLDSNLTQARDALAQVAPAPTQTAVRPAGPARVPAQAGGVPTAAPEGRISAVRAAAQNPTENRAWQTPDAAAAWATDEAQTAAMPPERAPVEQTHWPATARADGGQMPPTPDQVYAYPTSATPDASPVFPPQYQ